MEHPVHHVPPWLRGQAPPPHVPDHLRILSTAESRESKPAPGLFVDQPMRLNFIDRDRRPPSSRFRPSSIAEPKETHTVAVDIDEQTGNKLINEYEIIGELGRGEHGKVKLGVHGRTGRKVAIKVVQRYSKRRRLGKLGNPEDKVKREVAILKKARHPNVVSLLEVIDDSNQQKAYIVLEYVENGEIIWRRKGLPEICIVDKKRLEREKRGVADTQSFIAESQQFVKYARLQRERLQKERKARRKHGSHNRPFNPYGWSLEFGGDTDEELASSDEPSPESKPSPDSSVEASSPSEWRAAMETNRYWPDFVRLGRDDEDDLPVFGSPDLAEEPDDCSYVPCLTMRQVRSAFQDAVLGLEYLHYQGIIHRDIKPANLLVSKHKHIKISDFGVSYLGKPIRDDEDGDDISSDAASSFDDARELSKTVGTPAFYAPELCYAGPENEGEPYVPPKITEAIDIWSLGVTLYAMTFGRLPFNYDEHSLFHNIVHTPVFVPEKRLVPVESKPPPKHGNSAPASPPRSDVRADEELVYEPIDVDLRDLIKRLLTKDPAHRITTKEIKEHPWLLRDKERPDRWLADTDPSKQAGGHKIEVSREEVTQAVTRVPFMQRVKSNVARIGSSLFGKGIGSSTSTITSLAGGDTSTSKTKESSSRLSTDGYTHTQTPSSGSLLGMSRSPSAFSLSARLGLKARSSPSNVDVVQQRPAGEQHTPSEPLPARTIDDGQEPPASVGSATTGSGVGTPTHEPRGDGAKDTSSDGHESDDDYDDDDEDDGAMFFGGGDWEEEQRPPQPSRFGPAPLTTTYDSSWRLSTAATDARPAQPLPVVSPEASRPQSQLSWQPQPYYRRATRQYSARYDDVSPPDRRFDVTSGSDSAGGTYTGRSSYDVEGARARLDEITIGPDDTRETALYKQRQFQQKYFHPSLASNNTGDSAGSAAGGGGGGYGFGAASYASSRGSDWGEYLTAQHDSRMSIDDTYREEDMPAVPVTRSQSPPSAPPVFSSAASHRTGTSRTSLVLPDATLASPDSFVTPYEDPNAVATRQRVHVPVPDRDEPQLYARFMPNTRSLGMSPTQSDLASEVSYEEEEESDEEDGMLYLGRVSRPKIQMKKREDGA
ncbi:hypothetical protein KEM52_005537 [Ascosphaera acerosa]|nr:hypothetical protein KEM52_005537 [Ascosphaera acerosa]